MIKQLITTKNAPDAIGPYSQAIRVDNLIFLSGQIGIDPITKKFAYNDVRGQVEQIFENVKAVLKEAGASLENIVKTTVFLKNIADFSIINELYTEYLKKPFPARSVVVVKELPLSVDIEIEAIAVL